MNYSTARTVAKGDNPRKRRFLAALRVAGMTMDDWAKKHGSTQGYVSNLLAGRKSNEGLLKKVDAFAAKHLSAA